ncbi:MAG TPA: proline dehydrogenase family protein, partial [Candidatus Eisenbacteria bacterium]|nr:proline dehydrogenase family protein [Candidatus Eisenbacteria bacterium]
TWLSGRRTFTRAIANTGMRLGFARRFIAGESLEDALRAAAELNAKGLLVIMNQLGENIRDAADAEASYRAYSEILRQLAARKIDGSITIKPTQLALELDPSLCHELTGRLVREARELGNFVEIDMEHSSAVDATLALFERARSEHDNVGLAVQSYLFRTEADLRRLERYRPKIRLVKGAYQEPPEIAFADKRHVDDNYRNLLRLLFAGPFTPAVASHDEAMLAEAKVLAMEYKRKPDEWEVQMLLGVRRDLQESLAREGVRMRVYVTFGTEWVPYFMRRLAERPANLAFVIRSVLKGG